MRRRTGKENGSPDSQILPLGVSIKEDQIYFSVSIPNAKEGKLLLFQKDNKEVSRSISFDESNQRGNVFTVTLPRKEMIYDSYSYEASGKVFIDPYARRILGREVYGKKLSYEEKKQIRGGFDFSEFDWQQDKKPQIPYSEFFLYKLHVRGFTKALNSGVRHKGTYLGIIEKIPYLKELGVNGILLMPCVEFNEVIEENHLLQTPYQYRDYHTLNSEQIRKEDALEEPMKLNYWGYTENYNYFAPKASYASSPEKVVNEFKTMVRELHKQGMEVLMEMHVSEQLNPLMLLDCLRFWAMEYHVDGFRLTNDLGISRIIATDPYLSKTKLLNNDWNTEQIYERDLCPYYKNLADFNDGYSIDTRRFLKGDEGQISSFVEHFRENPEKKGVVHYLTDNNGFTLWDLYSYDVKHNEANGESNRDGNDYNYSWNCGTEGITRKKKVNELRIKMVKNALTILILSQAAPMLYAGDEFGNSQEGNNNAYCQDNETSWVDWKALRVRKQLYDYTRSLILLKKSHKVLHSNTQLRAMDYLSCGYPDISYHGTKAWCPEYINYSRTIGILLCGNYAVMEQGNVDNFIYFAFNMHWEPHSFDLPNLPKSLVWESILTTDENFKAEFEQKKQMVHMPPRSISVFISKYEEPQKN